jgi:formylglycine-generating enzyme required for sulfatase activity
MRLLGQGGFGRTFLAVDEDKPSKPRCVIKQFLPQAQGTDNVQKASDLFAQEAVRLDELGKHPQIPELLAYFTQDERQYLVQEFINGYNLAQELAKQGVFKEQQIRELLKDILFVLKFVHQNNVIHRDIKPANIIRRKTDNKLVLVDFGAAKLTNQPDLPLTVMGSHGYIAPEQAIGKPNFTSDLYSLGVTCIRLLTQVSPFELFDVSEGEWIWRKHLRNQPISDELGQILDKLIEPALKKRYQSSEEALAALNSQESNFSDAQPSLPTLPTLSVLPVAASHPLIQPAGSRFKTVHFDVVNITGESPGLFGMFKTLQTHQRRGQAEYLTLDLGRGVTLDLVSIPGGKFLRGSPEDEIGRRETESPQHWVTVPSFLMGKYPVTQAQYEAVMNQNPCKFKGNNRPVEQVSWNDCLEFCQKLSNLMGQSFRLPNETEWEYACRAGTTTPFYFGETITSDLANYDGNGTYGSSIKGVYRQQTTEVGIFPPNAFGLYDMHGNVWEWCEDSWSENDYEVPTETNGQVAVKSHDEPHILRGGSWCVYPEFCRSAFRDYHLRRDGSYYDIGFRVVCEGYT